MIAISLDVAPMIANLTEIEKRQLPFALMQALNQSMYEVRQGWRAAMLRVFDAPTPLTTGSVLYRKATKENLVATIYIRNEATKGTPPAAYLLSEVTGGVRQPKPFERMLRDAGIIGPTEYAVPAGGAPLDAYGNLRGGIMRALLADMNAVRGSAEASTRESRGKRAKRNRKREGAGVYFYQRAQRGRLPRGIYERMTRGFTGPSRSGGGGVRMILAIVSEPRYRVRFDARAIAQELFDRSFPSAFQTQLVRAILSARVR